MKVLIPTFALIAMALALFGCQSPSAGISNPTWMVLPPDHGQLPAVEMQEAKELYLNKCARCHKFYDPRRYSETDWRTWMRKMSAKAKLEPGQEDLLNRYLDGFRAQR